jgi:hypothetical protein
MPIARDIVNAQKIETTACFDPLSGETSHLERRFISSGYLYSQSLE